MSEETKREKSLKQISIKTKRSAYQKYKQENINNEIKFKFKRIPISEILATRDLFKIKINQEIKTQENNKIETVRKQISSTMNDNEKKTIQEMLRENFIIDKHEDLNDRANINTNIESNSTAGLREIKESPQKISDTEIEIVNIKSFGCKHYKRNCLIEFSCCNKLYECRKCHNKVEDHKCNRKEITAVACLICLTRQPFQQTCQNCNILFAIFICHECKFLSDDLETFHCSDCQVCRKGKKSQFFHCKQCDACLPIHIKELHENTSKNARLHRKGETFSDNEVTLKEHTHVENTLRSICPICAQDLFYSTSYVVLMNCGHSIHRKCFISYKNKSFQCPICLKSSSSSKTVNERIDFILEHCKDLNNQKNINSYECITSCFDCQAKFTSKYTYLYNKCMGCGSYNTRINELYKREDL